MISLGPRYPDNLLGRLMRLGSALARESRPVDHVVSPLRRPLDRAWYRHSGRLRELERLGASVSRIAPPASGPRVLVLSLRMWTHHTAYESVIGHALRLRGADVAMLTCGGGQPICEVGWGRRNAPRPCDRCAYFTDRVAARGLFPHLRLADEFPWGAAPGRAPGEQPEPRLANAEAAHASAAWFTKSGDPEHASDGPAVIKDFEVAVAGVEDAFARILDRFRPDIVFALNGLFAAEHAVRNVADRRGVRVVTYEIAPRKDALVFAQPGVAPDMEMNGLADEQLARPLTKAETEAVDELLRTRVTGASAHEKYFENQAGHDGETVRATLGLPRETRIVSAFTNLSWDTALVGKDLAFESQFDWLARAVDIVGRRDDTTLVIRVHPAESRWGTAQPVAAELPALLGALPRNVIVVPPTEPLSSYGLVETSDLVLCYTTTVALEAAVRGRRVAVGGITHYRGRGFTLDVGSREELGRTIADPPAMSADQVELARRYAFAFFFRRMIPFLLVHDVGGRLGELPESGDALLPGKDRYLDFVCDRIVDGGDFFLPPALALW
jgi:hypothetical protein